MSKLLQVNIRDVAHAVLVELAEHQGSTKTQIARQLLYEGLRARGYDPAPIPPRVADDSVRASNGQEAA